MSKYINGNLKSPNLFLFLAIVSSAIVLMLVGIYTYNVMEDVLENSKQAQIERSYVNDIRFFDEVLTNSALLAASTGDRQWEKRYRLFEPKLDNVIKNLIQLDTLNNLHKTLKLTDNANVSLVAMENRIFELVRDRKLNEAVIIMTGSEYARQKAIYSEGLSTFIKLHELETARQQTRLRDTAKRSRWYFGLIILLLAIVWLPIERFLRKSRVQMLLQNQELELQIQARQESESALLESKMQIEKAQEQLQESITASNVGLWERNLQTNEIFQSPEFKRQIGYSDDDVQGPSEFFYSHLHPEDAAVVKDSLQQLRNGVIDKLKMEYRFCHKDGLCLWMLAHTTLQRDQDGKPMRMFGSQIDITESKNSEQLIRGLNERFNLIAQATNDCVYDWDLLTNQVWWNPALSRLFGYSPEIITTDYLWWEEKIHPEDLDSIMQIAQKIFDEQLENWSGEYRFKRADGSYAFVSDRAIVLYDKDKNPVRWVGSIMDITERKQAEEKINLLAHAVKNSGDCIIITNKDHQIIFVNDSFCNVYGYKEVEIVGQPISIIHSEHNLPEISNDLFSTIKEKKIWTGEVLSKRKDGNDFPVQISLAPLLNDKGELIAFVAVLRDITERKQAEKSVAALSQRYQILLQTASDGIHVLDDQGYVVEANDAFCNMLGYTREELLQLNVACWDMQWAGEELLAKVSELITHPLVFETRHRRKDGTFLDVEINVVSITLEGRNYTYSAARDITKRKQAEELLRSKMEVLDRFFETNLDLLCIADTDGYFHRLNLEWEKTLGYTLQELEGAKILDFVHPDDIEATIAAFGDLSSQKEVLNFTNRYRSKDGTYRWIEWRSIPAGKLIYAAARDITGRMNAEVEIKKTNEELIKLNTEKDKFFSIIAHDLRSPFTSFLGLTQIMAEELSSLTMAEIQEIAVSMENSATNLYSLLENLLQWARMQQGLIPFNPEVIQLHKIADESIALMMESAKNKGIDIVCDIPVDIKVLADSNMLQTAIRNLVSNAVKFTPRGGKISLSGRAIDDKSVEIAIKDTGIGMSPEMLSNLFRLNAQINRKGTEDEPSTGLGLLLCKEFIEKQGGKIWVESEEGKGSTFKFTLPVG